jgi:ophiobolin F synthase
MQWYQVDTDVGKMIVLNTMRQYQDQFLESCAQYRRENNETLEKLNIYLDVLTFMFSGNLA